LNTFVHRGVWEYPQKANFVLCPVQGHIFICTSKSLVRVDVVRVGDYLLQSVLFHGVIE
jgi:hypothetical protein